MKFKNFDLILGNSINNTKDVFDIIKIERLTSEEEMELDFNSIVSITKSFIINNKLVENSDEYGFTTQIVDNFTKLIHSTDITRGEYESILFSLRYSGFEFLVIGRSDLDIVVEDFDEFEVKSYVLNGLAYNTTTTSNYYVGISRSYINDGNGIYPYAIDFVNDLGLSPEEMENYDMNASLSHFTSLAEINDLKSFDDTYAQDVIKSKGLKFYKFINNL